jgi:hypothetical protein
MPIIAQSGLVLIARGGGFAVYRPTAGPQIGYIEPARFGETGSTSWLAFGPQYLVIKNGRGGSRHFASRKAAAEASYAQEAQS